MKLNFNGHSREIKGILFDMDGVITDSMPWHFKCWRETLLTKGLDVSKEDIYRREGEKGLVSIVNLLAEKNINVTEEEAESLLKLKERIFKATTDVGLFEGIEQFIMDLAGKGIRAGVVTGTSRPEMEKLLSEKLISKFSAIVTGDMLEKGKPAPDPYLKGMELMEIENSSIVVVENAPLGIKSAKSAGLFTIAVRTSLGADFLHEADIIVSNHRELYSAFEM